MDRSTATDLECRELVELVTDYLEGKLPALEHERFEAHVAECEGCRRYLEQMRMIVEVTRRAADLQARPEIAGLLEAFRGYKRHL
jgi:anti-sigma factor RsiW